MKIKIKISEYNFASIGLTNFFLIRRYHLLVKYEATEPLYVAGQSENL